MKIQENAKDKTTKNCRNRHAVTEICRAAGSAPASLIAQLLVLLRFSGRDISA
jgi:hypothetical protein